MTFINTTNPYLDPDFDAVSSTSGDSPLPCEPRSVTSWPTQSKIPSVTSISSSGQDVHPAALCYTPELEGLTPLDTPSMLQSPPASSVGTPISPPLSLANTHFRSVLHHAPSMTPPPIDPRLASPLPDHIPRSSSVATNQRPTYTGYLAEPDYEVAYLMRWFSEGPGYWMDLFDLGTYFSSYVPVKAQENPLLKYAALAYSAKALARVHGRKPIMGGSVTRQAYMEVYPDAQSVDWYHKATQYYDTAVSLLLKALKNDATIALDSDSDSSEPSWSLDGRSPKRRRSSSGSTAKTNTDELLAASAILCVYEFLDASVPEWAKHLNGAKSLLVIAQERMMPLQVPTPNSMIASANLGVISKARKAAFWNIARQDMLEACKSSLLYYVFCPDNVV